MARGALGTVREREYSFAVGLNEGRYLPESVAVAKLPFCAVFCPHRAVDSSLCFWRLPVPDGGGVALVPYEKIPRGNTRKRGELT